VLDVCGAPEKLKLGTGRKLFCSPDGWIRLFDGCQLEIKGETFTTPRGNKSIVS
jgi:hypothetical protein